MQSKKLTHNHALPTNTRQYRANFRIIITMLLATMLGMGMLVSPASAAPLIKGNFSSPLDPGSYRMTSAFGPRCQPTMYASTHHNGQDMGAPAGTPIYAFADGKVVRAQADRVAGQWILIEHNIDGRKYYSSLSHTLDADRFVKVGTNVRRGQKVAEVGSTGVSTGPHLHFEIWRDAWNTGTPIDPVPFLRQRGIDLAKLAASSPQRPAPTSCTYYAYGTATLYSQPSASSRSITTVSNGTQMSAVPKDKRSGFLEISVNGNKGWMHESNISPTRVTSNAGGVGATVAAVNLRSGPGTNHKVITTLAYGARISNVLGYSNNWYHVRSGSHTGWVSGDYVTMTGSSTSYGFFLADSFTANANNVFTYGSFTDEFFVGDWNGNGQDTFAYRRGNTFNIRNSNTSGSPNRTVHYGRAGDVVLIGDWNGDGTDTFAVRRGKEYHFKNSISGGPADEVIQYGKPGDTVLVGDWNGDGKDTLAVRRGSEYHFKNSISGGNADKVINYGRKNDDVYVGDWNGDGKDTLAVRRGKQYFIKNSISGGEADLVQSYGRVNDVTYIGDWNGDGKDTLGILRTP